MPAIFHRTSKTQVPCFLSLPTEIRFRIYSICFEDSYTRYGRKNSLRGCKIVGSLFCQGPREHDLLVTSRQIYSEASPKLIESAYFLFDQLEISGALSMLELVYLKGGLSTWLMRVIQGTKRLVMSKPSTSGFWNSRAIFRSVDKIDIFGFYPTLQRWIRRDRTISVGWAMCYTKVFWYRTAMRPTRNPRVNLGRTARWLHVSFRRPVGELKIYLHAWELEDTDDVGEHPDAFFVVVDLDTKEILSKEQIMFRTTLDRFGSLLEHRIKRYHDFTRLTEQRRKRWVKDEEQRWPQMDPTTVAKGAVAKL